MGQGSVAMVGGIVLNPLSKYKILTYYNKALALKQGKMIPPRIAFIYPTYACNHNCPHCLYRGWNNGVHFPYDRLINLLEELYSNGVRGITLCGGGEPTLYPEFEGMVRHAKKLGIDLGLITNGSTLKKYGKFIINNFRWIRISVDSVTPDIYQKLHGVPIGSLVDNIKYIIKYRNETKHNCTIGVKRLMTDVNEHEQFPDLGADYLDEKYARECKGSINKKKSVLKGKCWLSPIHTMIDAYGDVYICCYYQYRKDKHIIGNVIKDSFSKIWYLPRHQEAIDNIDPKECNKYDCKFHGHNNLMTELFKDDPLHANFI